MTRNLWGQDAIESVRLRKFEYLKRLWLHAYPASQACSSMM